MNGSYLGPEYTQNQIEEELKSIGAIFETVDYEELINQASEHLSSEKAIAVRKSWSNGPSMRKNAS